MIVRGRAFCPAHVTGFFKAEMGAADGENGGGGGHQSPERTGSLGAGFSIRRGVTTTVDVVRHRRRQNGGEGDRAGYGISTRGFKADDTRVSEFVIEEFLRMRGMRGCHLDVVHEISVPVGYGLGCSGAIALSLAYALDQAMCTRLPREEIGRIAHVAEVSCKTGLGDVLASYHGGFEIRTGPGAPGIGRIERMESSGVSVVMACFAPVSTTDFLRDRLSEINGLGGRMVAKLRETRSRDQFQDMSLEFADYVDVMTPRMRGVADELRAGGFRCGVALFGETVFSLMSAGDDVRRVRDIVSGYGEAIVIDSEIDGRGARTTGRRGP